MPTANTSNATYVGTMLMSQVNLWLNDGATFSFFSGSHLPYAPYGIDWVTYNVASKISLTEASEEITVSAKRAGDRFRQVIMEFTAPVLCTVSASAITKAGGSGGTVQMLVDDVTTAQFALNAGSNPFDATPDATVKGSVLLLSTALTNLADGEASITGTFTRTPGDQTDSSKQLSQYFPLHECIAAYADYAPAILLKSCGWNVSTGIIDTVTGFHCVAFQEFWNSLGAGMQAEYLHHSKDRGDLVAWSCMSQRTWYLPLPFYYTHSAAQSLPARGLHNHPLSWTVNLNPAGWCITGAPAYVAPLTGYPTATGRSIYWKVQTTAKGTIGQGLSPLFYSGSFGLPATDLDETMFGCKIHVEVIYTTPNERNSIHYSSGEDVIVTHKDLVKKSFTNANLTDTSELTHYTTPKLVVQTFLMAVQRGSMVAQNKRMDFSGLASPFYVKNGKVEDVQPVLSSIAMSMNSDLKFQYTMDEFRLHTYTYAEKTDVLPGLMMYSLTIGSPYALQKKGGVAFAKVDDTSFTFTPNPYAGADHTAEGGIKGETATWQCTTLTVNIFGRGKGMGSNKWS